MAGMVFSPDGEDGSGEAADSRVAEDDGVLLGDPTASLLSATAQSLLSLPPVMAI